MIVINDALPSVVDVNTSPSCDYSWLMLDAYDGRVPCCFMSHLSLGNDERYVSLYFGVGVRAPGQVLITCLHSCLVLTKSLMISAQEMAATFN